MTSPHEQGGRCHDTISCRQLHVVDADGRTRIALGPVSDEMFGMALYDQAGRERFAAFTDPHGVTLAVVRDGNEVMVVHANDGVDGLDGSTSLEMSDKDACPRLRVTVPNDGPLEFYVEQML